ncbi:hypothetical protein B0J14DRAFT_489561 [Halenospora varia]|nr:hypothetical protein B0J14DRAFT_489561 [Halenospora varia]
MYKLGNRGSLLRKFGCHWMASNNPFLTEEEHSLQYKEWEKLLDKCEDLKTDMAMQAGRNWNGTFAWRDEHREQYMEKVIPLEEIWERLILSRSSRAEIESEAGKKDLRSMFELALLNSRMA